jgi:outer membrane protein with beta-barrel domain
MKCFTFIQSVLFYFFIGILISSCKTVNQMLPDTTLKASLDFAKVHETGQSNVKYDPVTKANTIVYSETSPIFGNPIDDDNNENSYTEQGIRFDPGKSLNGGFGAIGFGLEYIGKGAKFFGGNGTIGLNYLEVPIHFLYHYPIGPGHAYGGLGPYFAYGIGGRDGGESSFGENNGGFKRFDAGVGFMFGYKLSMGVSLDFGYDLGLANIEYASQDVKGHSRCFSINLGYQIGKLFAKKK